MPEWIVVGAGTGGTSATIGRYLRYRRHATRLMVVDPEGSAFFDGWTRRDPHATTGSTSRIEGIGRPRVEPSFLATVIDRMMAVPDAGSVAAMQYVERTLGRKVGPSTGTNLWGALHLVAELRAQGRTGSIVTLICDAGERYAHTFHSPVWLAEQGLDATTERAHLERLLGDPSPGHD